MQAVGGKLSVMRVILLQDVRNVGRIHDVKEVADGFAANFLLPRKLAEVATEASMGRIEAIRKKTAEEAAAEEKRLGEAVDSLRGKKITISARATEKGGLFEAVSAKLIARRIKDEYGIEFPQEEVTLGTIKTVGEHSAQLSSKEKRAELILVISALA